MHILLTRFTALFEEDETLLTHISALQKITFQAM
jgi:hypothetical protein